MLADRQLVALRCMIQMPDLVARLSGLHATLTTRLALQDSLLSLLGRLEMVLLQIELRSSAAPAPISQPSQSSKNRGKANDVVARMPARYVEGESEDEEESGQMDVGVEEDSNAGSIEDVELGQASGSEEESEDDENHEEEEEDFDDEDDEEVDDDGGAPRLNGFIDDEAEEDEESEEESE